MKLSNIAVIFIIIVLPIILVLSYYISLQIDTINMQTAYTTKQLQATREAIDAFEINTVQWNEGYSSNANSKRRDIMASINTFSTAFANGLGIGGASKESILPYIPAIVCTLHDGYYIYSPTETKEVIKDENGLAVFLRKTIVEAEESPIAGRYNEEDEGKLLYVYDNENENGISANGTYNGIQFTLDPNGAKEKYEHILKPFSTYSARYSNEKTGNNKIDITVNYTLDNFITIYGIVEGEYVTKSGYLININDTLEVEPENLTEKIAWRWNGSGPYTCEQYDYVYAEDSKKVYFDEYNKPFVVNSNGIRTDLDVKPEITYKKLLIKNDNDNSYYPVYQALVSRDDIEAGKWYRTKGNKYSERNDINGIDIKEDVSAKNYYVEAVIFSTWVNNNLSDIKIEDMQGVEDVSLYGNINDNIFNLEEIDPESDDSIIVNHKREVIKQTLISNLNQAITSYSRNSEGEYQLPILTENDWDHILRNVSIISFVQGMPIGMKYYNNYVVATSTQNKEFINPDEIYLTKNVKRTEDEYYHFPYCSKLSKDNLIGYRNIEYIEKFYNENKYYKHFDIANQACYYCLVQRDLYNSHESDKDEWETHDKAYKTALARERYNFYKVEEEENLYLYNYGKENVNITGGWYPSVLDTWSIEEDHIGAIHENTTSNYMHIGENSITGYGDGSFITGQKVEKLADYDYLCIRYEVNSCNQTNEYTLGLRMYLVSTPLFIQYENYNSDRENYKYKQLNGEKYENVEFNHTNEEGIKNFVQSSENKNTYKYSIGFFGSILSARVWNSTYDNGNNHKNVMYYAGESSKKIGEVINDEITKNTVNEAKIKLTDEVKNKLKDTGGAYIVLNSYAHEGIASTIDITVYQVYLTNDP